MDATANGAARAAVQAVKRLMVRMNPTLFYCVGAACLLEAARSPQAGCGPDGRSQWARWLEDYVATTWPEFDWAAAHAVAVAGLDALPPPAPGAAAHALRQAVGAAQAACFYGELSRWAEDPALREGLQRASEVETRRVLTCNAEFRSRRRAERLGFVRCCRRALAQVRQSRDLTVRCVFEILGAHWSCAAPFPMMAYPDFLARARRLMTRHVRLDWRHRLLLAPWFATPCEPPAPWLCAATGRAGFRDAPAVQLLRANPAAAAGSDACRLPPALSVR